MKRDGRPITKRRIMIQLIEYKYLVLIFYNQLDSRIASDFHYV